MRHRFVSRIVVAIVLLIVSREMFAEVLDYSSQMKAAVDCLFSHQEESGFFTYGYDFLVNEKSEANRLSAPNLTRQAVSAAVLADYYLLTKDSRAKPSVEKLLGAFAEHSLPFGKSRVQAVLEKSRLLSLPVARYKLRNALDKYNLLFERTGSGKVLLPKNDYSEAYTGATAFALLTELRYMQASSDTRFANLRQSWLEGLMALWIPGEGFREFPTSIDTTPYFDGEAWLALAEYHHAFPDDHRVAKFLTVVDSTLMENYSRDFKLMFFHWGTMAAAARYADSNDGRFLQFVKAQMSAFLQLREGRSDNDNDCAWVEGLADGLDALTRAGEGGSVLAIRAREWISREMRKSQSLQIQPLQKDLQFAHAKIIAPSMQEYRGCFRCGVYSADTQVDLTGHCLSAMVKLQRLQ